MDFVLSKEKRQSSRIRLNSPLLIVPKSGSSAITAFCVDFSHSGLSVQSPVELAVGTTVNVKLINPLGLAPFQENAKVVWLKPTSSNGKFQIGLELIFEA